MRTETTGGTSNICCGTDHRAWVRWSCAVTKPGIFRVAAEVAGVDGATKEDAERMTR
jgi:hypothetical protein